MVQRADRAETAGLARDARAKSRRLIGRLAAAGVSAPVIAAILRETAIARVEVSIDDGAWQEAEIVEEAGPIAWVRFELPWTAAAGEHTLRSRATDQIALSQPEETAWNAKGYQMNAVFPVTVTVR